MNDIGEKYSEKYSGANRSAVRGLFGLLFLALTALSGGISRAEDTTTLPGPVEARVVRVVDGDTIVVRARIWFGQDVETSVRVRGLDTPELKGRCPAEISAAGAARDYARRLLPAGAKVTLTRIAPDKYAARVDARVALPAASESSRQATKDERDFAQAMLAAGHGRPYDGGRRGAWCP